MIDKTQEDFENYLDGKSELSQLYTKSCDSKAPDNLTRIITEAAHQSPKVASFPAGKKAISKMALPFAIAATIILSVGIYWVMPTNSTTTPDSSNKLAKNENAKNIASMPLQQETSNRSQTQMALREKNATEVTAQRITVTEENDQSNSPVVTERKSLAQTADKTEPQDKEPKQLENTVIATKQSKEQNLPSQVPVDAKQSEDVEIAFSNENTGDIAPQNKQLIEEDEDTDFSLDWMNRLAIKTQDNLPATKPASSKLSPDKWLDNISKLHEQKRFKEAAASMEEFRKLYPYYKLPPSLKDAYDNKK